jgi:hypothetical protein
MKSRYTLIKASTVVFDALGNAYPDVCTYPIDKFIYSDIPMRVILTTGDIARFDFFCNSKYGTSDYTDLLLRLNNIASVHDLTAGQEFILPTITDINALFLKYQ